MRPTIAAAVNWPRSVPIWIAGVVDVINGCRRRSLERHLRSLTAAQRDAVEVVSIDSSEAYRQSHLGVAAGRADRLRSPPRRPRRQRPLDAIRRERQREQVVGAQKRRPPQRPPGQLEPGAPSGPHRILKASEVAAAAWSRRVGSRRGVQVPPQPGWFIPRWRRPAPPCSGARAGAPAIPRRTLLAGVPQPRPSRSWHRRFFRIATLHGLGD
jgi:hypothetical protein